MDSVRGLSAQAAKRVERVGSDAGAAAPGLRDAIEEAAAHQGRTISNMVDAVGCQFLRELSASSYLEGNYGR